MIIDETTITTTMVTTTVPDDTRCNIIDLARCQSNFNAQLGIDS